MRECLQGSVLQAPYGYNEDAVVTPVSILASCQYHQERRLSHLLFVYLPCQFLQMVGRLVNHLSSAKILLFYEMAKLLGNLACFHLGTWRVFTWELGVFSLGNLACFHLGTWHILTWEF